MHSHQILGARINAPTQPLRQPNPLVTIEAARSEAQLRDWLAIRNDVGTTNLTEAGVADSIRRNPQQVRLIATLDGKQAGAAVVITDRLKPGSVYIQLMVITALRRSGVGSALFACVSEWSAEHACDTLQANVRAHDSATSQFYEQRGMAEVERDAVVELDLLSAPPSPRASEPDGIDVTVLENRMDLARAVYAVGVRTWDDIPSSATQTTISYDEWWDCVSGIPGCSPEHLFVGLVDGEVVGYAQLELSSGEPDLAMNGFTGVLPEFRGRGIARAMKLAQIEWAKARGLRRIRTNNHVDNAPMRAINETLGYRPVEAVALLRGTLPRSDGRVGRVARIDRGQCSIRIRGTRVDTRVDTQKALAVGDWVRIRDDAGVLVIAALLPRRGVLARAAAGGATEAQIIAANVDVAFIVCALDVPIKPRRIERFIAMSWHDHVQPVIVLTKADVLPPRASSDDHRRSHVTDPSGRYCRG